MPPCHLRSVKLVAEAELPILPFLAPRLFQPWPFAPSSSSRPHSTTTTRPRSTSHRPKLPSTPSTSCSRGDPQLRTALSSQFIPSTHAQPWSHNTRNYSKDPRRHQQAALHGYKLAKPTREEIPDNWYDAVFREPPPAPRPSRRSRDSAWRPGPLQPESTRYSRYDSFETPQNSNQKPDPRQPTPAGYSNYIPLTLDSQPSGTFQEDIHRPHSPQPTPVRQPSYVSLKLDLQSSGTFQDDVQILDPPQLTPARYSSYKSLKLDSQLSGTFGENIQRPDPPQPTPARYPSYRSLKLDSQPFGTDLENIQRPYAPRYKFTQHYKYRSLKLDSHTSGTSNVQTSKKQAIARALDKAGWTAFRRQQASPTRTKWLQVGFPVDGAARDQPDMQESAYSINCGSLRLNRAAAKIKQKVEEQLIGRTTLDCHLDDEAAEYATVIFETAEMGLHVDKIEALFEKSWNEIWLRAALHLMDTSPEDLLLFLKISHNSPYTPSAWVSDCLEHLTHRWTLYETPVSQARCHELIEVLCSVMAGTRPPLLHGNVIRLLLPFCSRDQVVKIIECIQEYGVKTHWNTTLHVATALAHYGCFDRALDALLLAAASDADLQSPQYLSTCSTILRKAASEPDGLRVSLHMVQTLVDLGVHLNVRHCNVVMLNAVESGDFKSALNVYQSLVDNGLQADAYTYAILLKGCKTASQDPETLNDIIRQALRDLVITKEPVVALEILNNLYLHHFERNPDTAFSTMSEAYAQLFNPVSLINMKILPEEFMNKIGAGLMPPPLPAVGIMIMAYLRDRVQQRSRGVTYIDNQLHGLYKFTRLLAERGMYPWAALTRNDHMANSFLVAFTANEETLVHAAEVIRDMQTPLPAIPDHENPSCRVERPVCAPTVQSWSILLHGFARHKKMDIAEQVMEYMRAKGMLPNEYTWNHLMEGYLGVGDREAAVGTFERMYEEGCKGSAFTRDLMSRAGVDAERLGQKEARHESESLSQSLKAQEKATEALEQTQETADIASVGEHETEDDSSRQLNRDESFAENDDDDDDDELLYRDEQPAQDNSWPPHEEGQYASYSPMAAMSGEVVGKS